MLAAKIHQPLAKTDCQQASAPRHNGKFDGSPQRDSMLSVALDAHRRARQSPKHPADEGQLHAAFGHARYKHRQK